MTKQNRKKAWQEKTTQREAQKPSKDRPPMPKSERTCDTCKATFPTKADCVFHTFWCTNGAKCPACPGSDYEYSKAEYLHDHYNLAHARQGCRLCSGSFTPGEGQRQHFQAYHPGIDPSDEWREFKERLEKMYAEEARQWKEFQRIRAEAEARRWKEEAGWRAKRERQDAEQKERQRRKKQKKNENQQEQRRQKREQRDGAWEEEEDFHRRQEGGNQRPEISSGAPNHYHTLGVHSWSSQAEIEKAAKQMRIACHPDRLKRQEGLTKAQLIDIDEKAKRVGGAADVLTDSAAKSLYDSRLGACC